MDLYDLIYGETDDACGICGIRGPEKLTVHHIDGNPSNNIYENMIVLCHNCHQQHHGGKGLERGKIEKRKQHLIVKTLTQYGLNALKIADRNNLGVLAMPFLLYHLVDLGFMTKEEAHMTYSDGETSIEMDVRFAITPRGRDLLKRWFS